MRWPWQKQTVPVVEPPREESALDQILALMAHRALEEEHARAHQRKTLLNEAHRRLNAEEVDDPALRLSLESRIAAAEALGWTPGET